MALQYKHVQICEENEVLGVEKLEVCKGKVHGEEY